MSNSDSKPALVLIADDDESMRLLITSSLEAGGFQTLAVDGGQAALDAYEQYSPDLIMLDVDMPDMNGFDVCRQMRSSGGQMVPIVMVTGSEDTASIDTAFNVGATDFIPKPVNWSLLAHRVRYILRGSATRVALNASESRNRALVEALPDELYILDADGIVEFAVDNASTQSEVKNQNIIGTFFSNTLPVDKVDEFSTALATTLEQRSAYTLEFSRTNNQQLDARECRLLPHEDGKVLTVVRDVTKAKQAAAKIEELAYFDTLTGQTNRHLFLEKINAAVADCSASGAPLSLIYIGLDRFKRINDSLGHKRGDLALQAIAHRLAADLSVSSEFQRAPTLGRMVGDEFAVLVPDQDTRGAYRQASHLLEALIQPFSIDHLKLVVTASVGVASLPKDTDDATALLQKAETAMQHAKTAGRNTIRSYTQAMDIKAESRLRLENELRQAIANDQLELHFQPRFTGQDLNLCGAEALLRWHHAELGRISPAEFIPLAESTGLIHDVDQWVLNNLCRHIRRWQSAGLQPPRISLNLSATEFCRPDAAELVTGKIAEHGLAGAAVEIELTEGALMEDVSAATATLHLLKAAGLAVAIDDFGTGYSSLAYLKAFPVDVLKIDRCFVDQVDQDEKNQSICRAVISLAHGLGLEVVAEGVETQAEYDFLRNENCDQIQGYWTARPMPSADFESLMLENRKSKRRG